MESAFNGRPPWKCISGPTCAKVLIWNTAAVSHTNGLNLHFNIVWLKIDNLLVWEWQVESKVRRNIHTCLLLTLGSFILFLTFSISWLWSACVLGTRKGDLGLNVFFFLSSRVNRKWWMAWRFNDLVVERHLLKQALHTNCREMRIDFHQ